MRNLTPCYGKILSFLVNDEDPEAPLEYAGAISFPANHSKFEIKYDEVSDMYYTLASRITCPEAKHHRTLLSLMASPDAHEWHLVCDVFDEREADPNGRKIGFQYIDFLYEGDDIIFLSRTAMNDAANFHNSNYMTFHRIKDFRDLPICNEIL